MRDAVNLQIVNDEVILHILDSQHKQCVLSSRPVSLAGSPRLQTFFLGHIANSLRDPAGKAARFREIRPDLASGFCQGLLDGSLDLVTGSQRLAERLYGVMQANSKVASGDLAVCLYTAENYPGQRFLALLKIDPTEIFRQATLYDEHGRAYVTLELQSNALPTTREKLQKCAFVRSLVPRNPEFDLLLLDRQVGANPAQEVARFFMEGLLGAEYSDDTRARTHKLIVALRSAKNQIQNDLDLSAAENEDLDQRIQVAVTGQSIDLDQWLEQLPYAEEIKSVFRAVLDVKLQDRAFELDRAYAGELTRRRTFLGDGGLRVSLPEDTFRRRVEVSDVRHDDPELGEYRQVTIKTRNWKEVTR